MTNKPVDLSNRLIRLDRRTFHRLSLAGAGGLLGWGCGAWGDEPVASVDTPGTEPLPFVNGSFTIVALPDTQHYCRAFPQHFYNQTEWIVANRDNHNIQFVVHLGDIVHNNNPPQWEVAQRAIATLHGKVPYSLVPGNHDYGHGSANDRSTLLNEYFIVDKERQQSTFREVMNPSELENSYHTFSTRRCDFLILALEWGPRDEVVAWANEIVANHPDHRAILTTHAYMYVNHQRHDFEKYGEKQRWNPHVYGTAKLPGGTNDGQELWEKLVSRHDNFFMTLNGHVLFEGQSRLTSAAPKGNDVHQVLTNYQMLAEGGQGYLRLIEFLPDGRTVQMKTYSPSLGRYKTDPLNQFVLKLKRALWVSG